MIVNRRARAQAHRGASRWVAVGLLTGLLAPPAATTAHAQVAIEPGGASAGFSWSPLARIGELPRAAPLLAPASPRAFTAAPRIGLFWSGRNPAGLAWEVESPRVELGASVGGARGSYRRPLDPGGSATKGAEAIAWRPIGTRTAVAGHVAFDEVLLAPGTLATTLEPYASVPFTVSDSTRSDHSLSRVRLEGAFGWRVGEIGIGLSVGFDAADGHAEVTGVPRTTRASRPGAVLGVARAFAGGGVRLGAHGRWARDAETSEVFSIINATVVTRLNGFADPLQFTLPPGQRYYRRREAEGRAVGLAATGTMRGLDWAASAEVGLLHEAQWSQHSPEPPSDTWRARSLQAGAALQRALLDSDALITVSAQWQRNAGDARLAEEDSVVFRAEERIALISGELRWRRSGSPWAAYAEGTLAYDHRDRGDTLEYGLRTRLHGRTKRLAVEVIRELAPRVSVAGGYARTTWEARGSMPNPIHYPRAIRPLVGGEAAFHATPSRSHALTFAALLDATAETSFRLGCRIDKLTPNQSGIMYDLVPEGTRTRWRVEVSAILR